MILESFPSFINLCAKSFGSSTNSFSNHNEDNNEEMKAFAELSTHIMQMPDDEELNKFKVLLKNIIDSGKEEFVFNKGCNHAALLFQEIFDHAQETVCIYAKALRNQLTLLKPYCFSLLDCLERGVKVRILLSPTDNENSFLMNYLESSFVKNNYPNLQILSNATVAANMRNLINDDSHFTIADNNMYRIEYDVEEFKATASFNSPAVVKRLQEAFDSAWKKAMITTK